jgi:hypothetical protein
MVLQDPQDPPAPPAQPGALAPQDLLVIQVLQAALDPLDPQVILAKQVLQVQPDLQVHREKHLPCQVLPDPLDPLAQQATLVQLGPPAILARLDPQDPPAIPGQQVLLDLQVTQVLQVPLDQLVLQDP